MAYLLNQSTECSPDIFTVDENVASSTPCDRKIFRTSVMIYFCLDRWVRAMSAIDQIGYLKGANSNHLGVKCFIPCISISSKLWSSQLWTQFKQVRIEAWKSQDFNGVWTRDLAIPVRRSNQLSSEATDVGSWSFVSSNEPVKMWSDIWNVSYIELRIWNQVSYISISLKCECCIITQTQ